MKKVDIDEAYCDHFIRLRINKTKMMPKYSIYVANSLKGRSFIETELVTSAGQNTISQSPLFNLPINLPSLEEQAEIVRRVEALFAYADRLEARYRAARTGGEPDPGAAGQSLPRRAGAARSQRRAGVRAAGAHPRRAGVRSNRKNTEKQKNGAISLRVV